MVVKASDSHRLVRAPEVVESLLPLVPGAPTYRTRTEWRVESRGACRHCESFRCRCRCECGAPFEQDRCPECGFEAGFECWDLEASVSISESGGPAYPLRVDVRFGEQRLSRTSDPQAMLWVASLLREVAAESAGRFDIPVVGLPEVEVPR